ncbi:MAG: hypothetical protein GY851_35370 [bacterium]|nr:hypothetical protein [bacterium]
MDKNRLNAILACLLVAICASAYITKPAPFRKTADVVGSADAYEDAKGYSKAVSTSTSLAALLGEALPSDIVAVTLYNSDASTVLRYQCDGNAATATAFPIPAGAYYTAAGDKRELDRIRLYAGSSITIGIVTHDLD